MKLESSVKVVFQSLIFIVFSGKYIPPGTLSGVKVGHSPISCHWSLSIPLEKNNSGFLMFSGRMERIYHNGGKTMLLILAWFRPQRLSSIIFGLKKPES